MRSDGMPGRSGPSLRLAAMWTRRPSGRTGRPAVELVVVEENGEFRVCGGRYGLSDSASDRRDEVTRSRRRRPCCPQFRHGCASHLRTLPLCVIFGWSSSVWSSRRRCSAAARRRTRPTARFPRRAPPRRRRLCRRSAPPTSRSPTKPAPRTPPAPRPSSATGSTCSTASRPFRPANPSATLGRTAGVPSDRTATYDDAAAAGQRYEGGELTLNDVSRHRIEGDEASISFRRPAGGGRACRSPRALSSTPARR